MYKLTIFKGDDLWLVRHNDPEVSRLFGTDTLPTPFQVSYPRDEVLIEISKRNPDRVIEILD